MVHSPPALRAQRDTYLVQVLTTEHFALQTARSATIAEANGRTSLFINTVAAALIATTFVGQTVRLGPELYGFILVVVPVVVFLGVVTFVRLLETSMHDMSYVERLVRLRSFYLDIAPEFRPILTSPIEDDPDKRTGILRGGPFWWRGLLSSAGVVEVVNSVLIGVFCGLAVVSQLTLAPQVAFGIGALTFLVSLGAHMRYQYRRWQYAHQLLAAAG